MSHTRKRKKNIKLRGSRTQGYGSHKKHRGGGSRGGRGMAGMKKHKKTWMIKHMPGHLGKSGFKSLTQRKLKPSIKAINVRDLAKLAGMEKDGSKQSGKAVKPIKELDLTKLGFEKVLGGGSINIALSVKADYFTETAKAKIEQAKGKVITESGAEAEQPAAEK